MKAKIFVLSLLLLAVVAPSYGVTLTTDTSSVTVSSTAWEAYAHITLDNSTVSGDINHTERTLSAGGETLSLNQQFAVDSPMHFQITYTGGALKWTMDGVSTGVSDAPNNPITDTVRPTQEFNAIAFHLWTEQAGGNLGWSLTNLVVNGVSIAGDWQARDPNGGDDIPADILFYVSDLGSLSSITADVTLHSAQDTGWIDWDMAQFTISGVAATTPEPSTFLLVGIGIGALLLVTKSKISYRIR